MNYRTQGHIGWFALAAVAFFFAVLVSLGTATFTHDAVLLPLGLLFVAIGLAWPWRA